MNDPIAELGKLLQDAGATVKFGLRAQGHLPTIERMLDEGASWHAIGRAIGWSKHAACEYYTIHLREDAKAAQAAWVAELAELRAALKSCEEATCANFDAVSAERDNLRTARATAQAERSEALLECNCAVLERDAAILRAEQAEAALAQAQAERDEAQQQVAVWETVFRHSPSPVRPVAQPPALPPLPESWVCEQTTWGPFYRTHDTYVGFDGRTPPQGQVSVHADGPRVSATHVPLADLITVLRHAEQAHQQLKEGK